MILKPEPVILEDYNLGFNPTIVLRLLISGKELFNTQVSKKLLRHLLCYTFPYLFHLSSLPLAFYTKSWKDSSASYRASCISQAHLRQYPLLNEIVDGCFILQALMNPFSVVKDEIVCKLLVEEWFVVDQIEVIIDELLLDGPVVALNIGIDLETPRIGEEVGNAIALQSRIKRP